MTSDIFQVDVVNGTLPGDQIKLLAPDITPPTAYGKIKYQFRSANSGILSVIFTNITTGALTTPAPLFGGETTSPNGFHKDEIPSIPVGYSVNFYFSGAVGGSYDLTVEWVPAPFSHSLIWADTPKAILQTGCSYSQALVDNMGEVIEDSIRAELDMNGLITNPADVAGAGVGMLRITAQNWLCRDIRIQQKHDGTFPNSVTASNVRSDVAIDVSIKFYDDKGRQALDQYIRANTGEELDQGDEYAGFLFLAGEDL